MSSSIEPSRKISVSVQNQKGLGELLRLKAITDQLRNPDGGCDWDLKQDFRSMREDLLEEVYELIDAVNQNDPENLEEEIGDVLFLLLFYVRLGEEKGFYDLSSVAKGVADKLVRRHPHVFGNAKMNGVEDILDNWDKIKEQEKAAKEKDSGREEQNHLFSRGAYGFLPALKRADKISAKAARKGFDWPSVDGALAKLEEEIGELRSEIVHNPENKERLGHELGDVLFSIVNVARKLGLSAEFALQECTERFIERFRYIEDQLGRPIESAGLAEMDRLWNEAKALEPGKFVQPDTR